MTDTIGQSMPTEIVVEQLAAQINVFNKSLIDFINNNKSIITFQAMTATSDLVSVLVASSKTIKSKVDTNASVDETLALAREIDSQLQSQIDDYDQFVKKWEASPYLAKNPQKHEATSQAKSAIVRLRKFSIEGYMSKKFKARNISMDALLESPTLNTYGYAFKVNDWTLTSFKAKMLHDIKTKIAELIESDQYDAQSIDVEYLVSTMLEDECLELTEDISNVMRAVIHNAMSSDQAQVALALVKTAVVTAGRKVSGDLVDRANELLAQ